MIHDAFLIQLQLDHNQTSTRNHVYSRSAQIRGNMVIEIMTEISKVITDAIN